MLGERMDEFAPAPSKLVEFAGDDLLRRRWWRRHRTWPASEPGGFVGRRRIRGSARLRRIHGSVARRLIAVPREENCNENNEQAAAHGHAQPAKTIERFTPRRILRVKIFHHCAGVYLPLLKTPRVPDLYRRSRNGR